MSSYRTTSPNEVFKDQFSVYDADGYTKKSGLDPVTGFDISMWKDCVVSSKTVTIVEIGTSGEYQISFTPDEVGFWELEVHVLSNDEIWGVSVECSLGLSPKIIEA